MKLKLYAATLACIGLTFNSAHAQRSEHDLDYYVGHAPFKMQALTAPHFNAKTYDIKDYGAIGDGQTLNTQAINKAITTCSTSGGGTVIIPQGLWLTGPIELKSNVDLHTDRGALVIFSTDHKLYPIINGKAHSPISGNKLENVALTGEGIYDGGGDTWRPLKKSKAAPALWSDLVKSGGVVSSDGSMYWPTKEGMEGEAYVKTLKGKKDLKPEDYLPARDFLRPVLAVIQNSKNVLIDGPTFKNAPMFALNPRNCSNMIIRNVTINNEYYAQNGDGIDLSACKNAAVYHCTVNAGDDGICMKSSGGKGDHVNDPALENIIIADCIVYHAHGGFVIGSNTDGGMRNVYVTNCNFVNTDVGIRVKSSRGRGGLVHDIYLEGIYMRDILNEAILFSTYYEDNGPEPDKKYEVNDRTPRFQDFYLSNIYCNKAKAAISITGLPEMPVNHIKFTDVTISADKAISASEAADISFKNVKILSPQKTLVTLDNAANFTFDHLSYGPTTKTLVSVSGSKTKNVKFTNTDAKSVSETVQVGKDSEKGAVVVQ